MTEINFRYLRNHHGTQNGGFEELCCQLAGLEKPHANAEFICKEGAGGDAGVGCYWRLPKGDEHAWQVKYFMYGFGQTQIQQLDKPITAALKGAPKHGALHRVLPD